jgi:hypothetical protein
LVVRGVPSRGTHTRGVMPWPRPTHAWPPPDPCMFGAALLPGVTVGEAMGLNGYVRRARGASVVRRDHPTSEPCPTLCDGSGGSGGVLRIIGGGRNHPADANGVYRRDSRDITDEPSTTIVGTFLDGQLPKVQEYHKGGPNGCLAIDAPSHTIGAGSREPIQNWKSKRVIAHNPHHPAPLLFSAACAAADAMSPSANGRRVRPCFVWSGETYYKCRDCNRWRPKSNFSGVFNPKSACGIQSYCKPCHSRRTYAAQLRREGAANHTSRKNTKGIGVAGR